MEVVPFRSIGTAFQHNRDGKPVPGATVTVISPDKLSKTLKAGADGSLTVPMREKGRYLLIAKSKKRGLSVSKEDRLAFFTALRRQRFPSTERGAIP